MQIGCDGGSPPVKRGAECGEEGETLAIGPVSLANAVVLAPM